MLQRLTAGSLLAWLLVLPVNAGAEPVASATAAAKLPEVRRDARGLKGISPFTEALKRGDNALLTRDLPAAILAYRDAIEKEPGNALGHYRLGEAQVIKGDLQEAEAAFSAGLRLVASDHPSLKAKLQFALADLRERQKSYDEAILAWAEYEALTSAQKDAQGFPASGSERKKAVLAWMKSSADSAEVRGRIEKGLQAADEAVKKSSK